MKYVVTVYEVYSVDVEVEADGREQAREIVADIIENSGDIGKVEYAYTTEPEEWGVEKL